MESLTTIVKGTTAKLTHVCHGKIYYQIVTENHKYQLEIDSMEKEWELTYLMPEFKAISLMRWIRRGIHDGTFISLDEPLSENSFDIEEISLHTATPLDGRIQNPHLLIARINKLLPFLYEKDNHKVSAGDIFGFIAGYFDEESLPEDEIEIFEQYF